MTWPVIGIAGPSCSGKSSLASLIAGRTAATHLCLDRFWIRKAPAVYRDGFRSFERPDLYDGKAMASAALTAAETGPVVAEGFLLFRYHVLWKLSTHRYYLDLPDDDIRARRIARRQAGKGGSCKAEASFDAIGLAEWREQGRCQAGLPRITILDGRRPAPELADAILREINLPATKQTEEFTP